MNYASNGTFWRVTAVAIVGAIVHVAGCHRAEGPTIGKNATVSSPSRPSAKPPRANADGPTAQRAKAQHAKVQRKPGVPGGPLKPAGFGTGSDIPTVCLVGMSAVQQELNIDDKQRGKLAAMDLKLREAITNWSESEEGKVHQQMHERLMKLYRQMSDQLMKILNETQQKRLAAISVQINDISALTDPFVAARLNITSEQDAKLVQINKNNKKANQNLKKKPPDGEPIRDMRATSEELRSETDRKVLALLTDDQKRAFNSLRKPRRATSLNSPAMVKKLNITAAQRTQLATINQALKQEVASVTESMSSKDPANTELQAKLEQLRSDAGNKMLALLTSQQKQAFASLPAEPYRPSALTDPAIAEKIKLTDPQKAKLEEIRSTDRQTIKKLTEDIRAREKVHKEKTGKLKEMQSGADKEMLAVLTVEQSLAFASLKSQPAKLDRQQLQASIQSAK